MPPEPSGIWFSNDNKGWSQSTSVMSSQSDLRDLGCFTILDVSIRHVSFVCAWKQHCSFSRVIGVGIKELFSITALMHRRHFHISNSMTYAYHCNSITQQEFAAEYHISLGQNRKNIEIHTADTTVPYTELRTVMIYRIRMQNIFIHPFEKQRSIMSWICPSARPPELSLLFFHHALR